MSSVASPPSLLRAFYARHPTGALRTALVHRGPLVAVRAALYRSEGDERPAATALAAWERRLQPPYVRTDATLRAAEARAIDQVLRYLGVELDGVVAAPVAAATPSALRQRVADLEALIRAAVTAGVRPRRAEGWRARLGGLTDASPAALAALDRAERRLRIWVSRADDWSFAVFPAKGGTP